MERHTPSHSTSEATPLIRPEAIEAQRTPLIGTIALAPRISSFVVCVIGALLASCIVAFFYFGSYTRRATVPGHLQPSTGVIRVTVPQTGVITEKQVVDGQMVKKDDVLFIVDSERKAQAGSASSGLQQSIAEQITQRQKSMQDELGRLNQSQSQELAYLAQRSNTLKSEAQAIEALIEQQRQRVSIAEDLRQRYKGLAEKDYIAGEQLTQKQLELSEQQSRLQVLRRDLITNQREQASTRRDSESLTNRIAIQTAQLKRSMSAGNQELAEAQTRSRVLITAPQSGRATLVATEVGQTVDPGKVLLSIVPSEVPLQARLFVPSRHMGFVKVGDSVLLRYEAYPYQMFGQHTGRVSNISNAPASSQELASSGIAERATSTEPLYVIQVDLAAQGFVANGQRHPLQAGARLEADLVQEKRKLWQWALEPLYTVTRKAAP